MITQPTASNSPSKALHTNSELYAWTLRRDAIAPCLAEDVLQLRDSGIKDLDFYWLGRVPCRSVRLVGTIVGIRDYETRRMYSIDDGTAVIDCIHRPLPPLTPSKKRSLAMSCPGLPPPLPPPVTSIGLPVAITGVPRSFRQTKQLVLDEIIPCSSINDEARHWKLSLDLHHSRYFSDSPFSIPANAPVCDLTEDDTQTKPVQTATTSETQAPPKQSVRLSLSPTKPTSTILPPANPQSPPRLRHPSRLRTRELTANTFRIYVKHYMDNYRTDCNSQLDFDLSQLPATPTKRRRMLEVLTPKLSSNYDAAFSDEIHRAKGKQPETSDSEATIRGFTLSYLRRVPELQEMARKVTDAEDKMKRREGRKAREDAKLKRGQSSRKPQPKPTNKACRHDRIKKLFRQAILKLCDDGGIVIWDGPKKAWRQDWSGDASRLWRMEATADITASSWAETTGGVSVSCDQEEDELSDPSPDEESYVSLTPPHLGKYVEIAIRDIMLRPIIPGRSNGSQAPKGPTKEEILVTLRADGRWRRVGDWAVEEALMWLKEEERVWDVGEGRWELTL